MVSVIFIASTSNSIHLYMNRHLDLDMLLQNNVFIQINLKEIKRPHPMRLLKIVGPTIDDWSLPYKFHNYVH